MSQSARGDLEKGSKANSAGGKQTQSTPNSPSRGEFSFGDSSGPLFTIYSKATEEEDRKMVKRWQKYADGVFIFTGLFSAAVAAFLTVTIQDLKQSSQDTSAFYLGNIYEVLADPNTTRAFPVAKPPSFSPPRHAIRVNSLWFSSLVTSLCCALLATSLHQWARRYVRLTRHAGRTLEKRARMRAFFASGVDRLRIPWAVEGLPTLLHLSLLLFFAGLAIFLFNLNKEVFKCVVVWIGIFSMVYGLITLLPLIRHDSPYYTPLSVPAWLLYAGIPYVTFKVLAFITYSYGSYDTWKRCDASRDRYCGWVLGGMEKVAEEMAAEQSSEIDVEILGWTISALGDDDVLEEAFVAIPGFFNSKLVKNLENGFSETLLETFWSVLDGFLGRTLSSNLVPDSVKSRRVNICKDIMNMIPCLNDSRLGHLRSHFDQAPVSIERMQAMARWFSHKNYDVAKTARIKAAKNLPRMQERDKHWIALASDVYRLPEHYLQLNVALGGDNVFLVALINICRQGIHLRDMGLLEALTHFDICHTLPELQRDFCALWNEFVQEARNQGSRSIPVVILCWIRRLYISLHEGTDAAPIAFSASTPDLDPILDEPLSYPLCSTTAHCHSDSAAVLYLTQPTDSTTSIDIGDNSRPPTGRRPTDPSPPDAAAAAQQDTHLLPHTLSGPTHRDISTTGHASSNSLLPTSSVVGSSIPSSPLPSHVPPSPNAELPVLLSSAAPSRPTGNATLPRLRARRLVNTGGVCFVNAVLQLLVHSPPFWNLCSELGDMGGQRGEAGLGTGGGATPLVDATVRFFEEFMFKQNEPPPMQEPPRQAAGEERREGEEAKKGHNSVGSFKPTYMYDAMKKKRQLKTLLDDKHQNAEKFLGLYLDALDEELVELHTFISTHMLASTASVEGFEDEAQQAGGQTEVGKREYAASSVESLISRIFGGRSRSTVRTPGQPDIVTIEAWCSLQLDIQHDSVHAIQDALTHILQPQPVQVQVGQSTSSKASWQAHIEVFPPILVLRLKRFLYDVVADSVVKNSKPVQFSPELDIPPEIMAPVTGKSAESVHYKLYGVLYHHGESASSGHYTVDVLHQNGDSDAEEGWLHIDDEAVSALRREDVFSGQDDKWADDRCVYMLFYCRTAPTRT